MRVPKTFLLFLVTLAGAHPQPHPRTRPKDNGWAEQEWDAIIVGAGTAGIIVADRLSEAGLRTLLLEQGGPSYGVTGGTERPSWLNGTDMSRVDVPGLYSTIFGSPNSSLLCKPSTVRAYQACTVGGNSAINAGLYFQPPASDWDNFHPPGWHSADVRAATDRLLRRQPPVTVANLTSLSAATGPYSSEDLHDAVRRWVVRGAGYREVDFAAPPDDKDGPYEKAFGRAVFNYVDGQRGGPVRTYLQTALARPRTSFRLATGVRVRHVVHEAGVASGVAIEVDANPAGGDNANTTPSSSVIRLAHGGRVVLSAGALQSPQLLMYSGIGPEDTLRSLAAANPPFTPYAASSSWVVQPAVGRGLFDNPNTFIELSSPAVRPYRYRYEDPAPEDKDLYLRTRGGPYSSASPVSVFWTYVDHDDNNDSSSSSSNSTSKRSGVQGTISASGYAEYQDNHTVTLNVYGTSGLGSAGRVVLSNDGRFVAGPSSDVYYSDPRDARAIARFVHDLFQALPSSSTANATESSFTPLNIPRNATVDDIRAYITTWSAYAVGQVNHWSSSCRIGDCVDTDTRVIGTSNVHVVDASILSPLTVNPQFAVMVAGEKGAERILALRGSHLRNGTHGTHGTHGTKGQGGE